jgi:ferrochelatase
MEADSLSRASMGKLAVVMLNLGGPDRPESVRPFLFNLFNDPAIIGAPGPLRWALAQFISRRRAPAARAIYAEIGGGSPLLANTEAQADALADALAAKGSDPADGEVRVFVAMRYWHPRSDETAAAVAAFAPDEIVLLPLYPQYSTTTTASSLADWGRAARRAGLAAPTRTLCCYPVAAGWIASLARLARGPLAAARAHGTPRLLLSAHGLPEKVVSERGDPYQWQVEETAAAVAAALGEPDLDWRVCYQSRVGPLAWIGPGTDEEIRRAGRDGVPVVLCPIAFVSEHSETLVELDITSRKLAAECGVPHYTRVPAVGVDEPFVTGLAGLVRRLRQGEGRLCSMNGGRRCPARLQGCPLGAA